MKACVLHDIGVLRYEDVPIVAPKKGEVLVHIKACGICGSDIPRVFTEGTYRFPTIPGHEFAGIVEAAGSEDEQHWVGKKVAIYPLVPCKTCDQCQVGKYAQCEDYSYFGSRCDGGFSEYISVPVWNLVPVQDNVSLEEAAMCEPAAVAYHATSRANILPGENVLVVGAGTIGLMVAMWARVAGAAQVILADVDQTKLDFAKKLGFSNVVCSAKEDLISEVNEITQKKGVLYAFDCVGFAAALENCLMAVAPFGNVVTVGNPAVDMLLHQNAYWNILRKELQVFGTWNSSYVGKNNDWVKVMSALDLKQIDLKPLITHRYSLEEHQEAFNILREKKEFAVKVMFVNEER